MVYGDPMVRSHSYPLVNIQKAIENDHLYPFIVDFPIENGGCVHSFL